MRLGPIELSDQSVRTWVPFILRKVLVGRRITRLTELLWAIHLFLHFLTKPGETFIIHRPRGYSPVLLPFEFNIYEGAPKLYRQYSSKTRRQWNQYYFTVIIL